MEREKRSRPECGQHLGKKLKLSAKTIKLSVGDSVIVADREKLTEISPFFDSLLRFHADDDLKAVSLAPPENVDLNSFVAMLNSLTSTSLELIFNAENLWDFIILSNYFQVAQIGEKCLKAFRSMLPTLTMNELFRLWRNGHACAVNKVTTLALAGISLKMEQASESAEFLDLSADELVALMSDEAFLPLMEKSVCKAVITWCLYDPEERKNTEVLNRVFAEVVWDEPNKHLIQSMLPPCQEAGNIMPKRTVNTDDHKFPDNGLLKEVDADTGIIIGNCLYYLWNSDVYDHNSKSFYRMDMSDREGKKELNAISIEELKLDPEHDSQDTEWSLCLVRVGGGDKIGCFGSTLLYCRLYMDDPVYNVGNIIALYDIATNKWQNLPCLPLPRAGCAMIQCGSFLYVIGGNEHKALDWTVDKHGEIAHHCVRLDLLKFTEDHGKQNTHWERIADLNTPRTNHHAEIQHGRIIVSAGQTRAEGENGRWSEAYDPTMNCWTVLKT